MIEFMDETHDSILAIRFTGKLTQAVYDQILVPRIEAAAQSLGRVRALRAQASDARAIPALPHRSPNS